MKRCQAWHVAPGAYDEYSVDCQLNEGHEGPHKREEKYHGLNSIHTWEGSDFTS